MHFKMSSGKWRPSWPQCVESSPLTRFVKLKICQVTNNLFWIQKLEFIQNFIWFWNKFEKDPIVIHRWFRTFTQRNLFAQFYCHLKSHKMIFPCLDLQYNDFYLDMIISHIKLVVRKLLYKFSFCNNKIIHEIDTLSESNMLQSC